MLVLAKHYYIYAIFSICFFISFLFCIFIFFILTGPKTLGNKEGQGNKFEIMIYMETALVFMTLTVFLVLEFLWNLLASIIHAMSF